MIPTNHVGRQSPLRWFSFVNRSDGLSLGRLFWDNSRLVLRCLQSVSSCGVPSIWVLWLSLFWRGTGIFLPRRRGLKEVKIKRSFRQKLQALSNAISFLWKRILSSSLGLDGLYLIGFVCFRGKHASGPIEALHLNDFRLIIWKNRSAATLPDRKILVWESANHGLVACCCGQYVALDECYVMLVKWFLCVWNWETQDRKNGGSSPDSGTKSYGILRLKHECTPVLDFYLGTTATFKRTQWKTRTYLRKTL